MSKTHSSWRGCHPSHISTAIPRTAERWPALRRATQVPQRDISQDYPERGPHPMPFSLQSPASMSASVAVDDVAAPLMSSDLHTPVGANSCVNKLDDSTPTAPVRVTPAGPTYPHLSRISRILHPEFWAPPVEHRSMIDPKCASLLPPLQLIFALCCTVLPEAALLSSDTSCAALSMWGTAGKRW